MSTAATVQPPGQPQSKAAPIAQLTKPIPDQTDNGIATRASEGLRTKSNRPVKDSDPNGAASLLTTVVFIQRVLAPDKTPASEAQTQTTSIEDILPPLTSSNEIDIELYAILAVVIKELVNTWYTKITNDHGFVEEIIQIIAHCSRALEQRLRRVDLATLVLDEVPILVQRHVEGKESGTSLPFWLTRAQHIALQRRAPQDHLTLLHYDTPITS